MATTPPYSGNESHPEPATSTANGTVISTVTDTITNTLPIPKHIILLSLYSPPWFEADHENLIRALPSVSDTVLKAENSDWALEVFSYPDVAEAFAAVLITDHGIAYEQHSPIWHALLDNYVRKGGRVIICCGFPYGVNPRDFDVMLAGVEGLGWRVAGCSRRNFMKDGPPSLIKDSLPDTYDWNVITLKAEGMKLGESWYLSTEGDSATAMAKVGEGWLGYVGNVDADEGTAKVVLGMCGLLDEAAT